MALVTSVLDAFSMIITLALVVELEFFGQLGTLHSLELGVSKICCLIDVKYGLRFAVGLELSYSLLVGFEDFKTLGLLFSVFVVFVEFTSEV